MKAIVFLADGFEEVEALTPVDYLRRAGVEVTVAGVSKKEITGSHGIKVCTDTVAAESLLSEKFDALIAPGGMLGSSNLAASPVVEKLFKDGENRGAVVAAICAAPVVVLANYKALTEGSVHLEERVVVDGNLVTARGAGVAEEFALALVEKLAGKAARDNLHKGIVAR